MRTRQSFPVICFPLFGLPLLSSCSTPPVEPTSSAVAIAPAAATSTPPPQTDTPIPPTETATATATMTPSATPTPTESATATATATSTLTLTPTSTATATKVPTRRPTSTPAVALKCPPLPPYQGQTLPFDPPLPLPLSKIGFGDFGAIVFHNSTNQPISIKVVAGNVTNHVDLPVGTEFSAVVLPGTQHVMFNYPPPQGTDCTYQVSADQVLFMRIGDK